jgi:hypothetical protein
MGRSPFPTAPENFCDLAKPITDQIEEIVDQAVKDVPIPKPKMRKITAVFDAAQSDLGRVLKASIEERARREERYTEDMNDLRVQLVDLTKQMTAGFAELIRTLQFGVSSLSYLRTSRIVESQKRQDLLRQLSLSRLKLEAQMNRHFHDREDFEREAFSLSLSAREFRNALTSLPTEKPLEHDMIVQELMLIELAMNDDRFYWEVQPTSADVQRERRQLTNAVAALEKLAFTNQALGGRQPIAKSESTEETV